MEDKSELSLEEFTEYVANGATVVDFFATWCSPCKLIAPILSELSEEKTDYKFVKIDIEKSPDVTAHFGITSVPSILMFKDGELKQRIAGALPKKRMEEEIDGALG